MFNEDLPLSESELRELALARLHLAEDPHNFDQLVPYQRDYIQELMLRDWLHKRSSKYKRTLKARAKAS